MLRIRLSHGLGALAAAATLAACGGVQDAATGAVATATGPSTAVNPATTTDCTQATRNPAKVVCLATAFRNTLSATQSASVEVPYTSTYAVRWSNLPCGAGCRNGLQFSTLSSTQLAAVLNLAKAALSSAGYGTMQSIRAADTYLGLNGGGNNYNEGIYFVAFVGTPSTTSPWILQLGGHHLAINLHYNGTQTPTATPNFVGVEPQLFTLNGVTYTPLQSRKVAMYSMINSLDATQAAAAKLSSSFSDVLLGPGQDGQFPTREGLAVSSLSAAQQQLVKNAIEEWVKLQPTAEASTILAAYESEAALANTTVSWSGSRDSTVQGSYIRIDGPRVWIEFVCQAGVVFRNQIHFHTIWRDREQDYGGDFTFAPGTGTTPGTPGTPGTLPPGGGGPPPTG